MTEITSHLFSQNDESSVFAAKARRKNGNPELNERIITISPLSTRANHPSTLCALK